MEIKEMVALGREAQREFEARFNQEGVDRIVRDVAKIIYDNAETLAREAVDETGMGVYEDKVAKNRNKSKGVWYNLRGKASMGILSIDKRTGLIEIAKPIGVLAAIIPTTNPIVTPMSNAAFALKTRNAMIFSPHPRAKNCTAHTVQLIREVLAKHGAPENMVQVIDAPSIEATQELMKSCDVVVATGGMGMVKSAYSSGKPSFGVGQGNVQVIFDTNIDFEDATEKVITGRAFDNGIICSGEQSIIYNKKDKDAVFSALKKHGAYICSDEEGEKVRAALFENGALAKDVVGQSVETIAKKAGINVPEKTRVIVMEAKAIGDADVACKEKMCPVLSLFSYDHLEEAIHIAKTNLEFEGNGHTAAVHSANQANIIKIGTELSVSRLVVNAPSATTAGGHIQNGLNVTNTLGCGTWGNNSISENLTYFHLMNVTRIAPLCASIQIPSDEEMWQL